MRRAAAFLLLAFGTAGCAYAGQGDDPYRPAMVAQGGEPADGRALYLRDCAWCHGDRGEGTPRGPDILTATNGPAFTNFMLSTGRMPLRAPEQPSRRGEPAYSPEQIAAIVEYVEMLGATGPDIPAVDPLRGDIGLGQELYAENCASCHATTLIGGAISSVTEEGTTSANAPSLFPSTPTEIAEAMLVGPGTMPVFGAETFTPHEVDSIVRYVVELQDPNDRGGAPVGHVGPVSEGAVGWIVGLGALLVVARWIGTRSGDD